MKKILSLLTAAIMLASSVALPSCGTKQTEQVYVTVVNGKLNLAYDRVELTDTDGDGKLTVNDALYNAHDKNFEGGAAAGYKSESTEYGLSLLKLWGIDNGGSYGYLVNNTPSMRLADEVKTGDHIVAYVYQDTETWSDTYSFFDVTEASAGELTLTLKINTYDENYNTVAEPLDGATITINGEPTEYVTNTDGAVTVRANIGDVISAVSADFTLVSPVCIIK